MFKYTFVKIIYYSYLSSFRRGAVFTSRHRESDELEKFRIHPHLTPLFAGFGTVEALRAGWMYQHSAKSVSTLCTQFSRVEPMAHAGAVVTHSRFIIKGKPRCSSGARSIQMIVLGNAGSNRMCNSVDHGRAIRFGLHGESGSNVPWFPHRGCIAHTEETSQERSFPDRPTRSE